MELTEIDKKIVDGFFHLLAIIFCYFLINNIEIISMTIGYTLLAYYTIVGLAFNLAIGAGIISAGILGILIGSILINDNQFYYYKSKIISYFFYFIFALFGIFLTYGVLPILIWCFIEVNFNIFEAIENYDITLGILD